MKTKIRSMAAMIAAIIVFATVFISSCGKDGANGVDGINGKDGKDGKDAGNITAADQAAYDAANGINGGLAYNQFYAVETGFPQPVDTVISNHKAFFQCAACHGRDMLGTKGNYINRAPNATRPAVDGSNLRVYGLTHNIKEIFDAVKHSGGRLRTSGVKSYNSNMPDYSNILSDALAWDIVKFLKEETVNTDALYDLTTTGVYPTGTFSFSNIGKDGDKQAGETYYAANCASCHGSTGSTIPGHAGETVGAIARAEPYWLFFQLKFGRPGTAMQTISTVGHITLAQGKDLYKALSDSTDFPN